LSARSELGRAVMLEARNAYRCGRRADENPHGPIGVHSYPDGQGGTFYSPNASNDRYWLYRCWEMGWQKARAYDEGRAARLAGLGVDANPYTASELVLEEWLSGWRQAAHTTTDPDGTVRPIRPGEVFTYTDPGNVG
jgi:ribosome modulation factor